MGRLFGNDLPTSTAGTAPPYVVWNGWRTTESGHRIKFLIGQIDGGTGDDAHRGCTADILTVVFICTTSLVPLGDPLMRLVASIVEPKRSCVIGLPLDDVAGFGG